MKVTIFTSNSIRHKFFANSISKLVDETLVICETRKNDPRLNQMQKFQE